MAYRKFETQKAKYVLQLVDHDTSGDLDKVGINLALFGGIDGLVIEQSHGNLKRTIETFQSALKQNRDFTSYPMYRAIEQALERNIPFYCVDVDFGKDWDNNRKYTLKDRIVASIGGALLLDVYGRKPIEFPERVSRGLDRLVCWQNDPNCEGRNAINAMKIEEGVVPRLCEVAKLRKPSIGLVYGFLHSGIEQNLKDSERRKRTIGKMKKFDDFNGERFRRFQEGVYNPQDQTIDIREFDTELF
ncbi:MAG: hypothetical protein WC533_03555 [Candidatus Pacearchaeota archaeon]